MDGLVSTAMLIFAGYFLHKVHIIEAKNLQLMAFQQQKDMMIFMENLAKQRKAEEEAKMVMAIEAERKLREQHEQELRKKRMIATEDGQVVDLQDLEPMF